MSNYMAPAVHPRTLLTEEAEWLDNYYGHYNYGVRFADGSVFRAEDIHKAERRREAIIAEANERIADKGG